jgi:hypothetical protein
MLKTLVLAACNGCSERTNPFYSKKKFADYLEKFGWETVLRPRRRTMHFCPKCVQQRRERSDAAG